MRRMVILGLMAAASGALAMALAGVEGAGTGAGAESVVTPRAAGETVACRVLEAHTSDQDRMTVVVFHQRDAGDRARLGEMIRQFDGFVVRFETAEAKPHSATLFRLKSCFGRGLLLFPASSAHLTPGDEFELQVGAQ
jgi:hypothetical protein